MLSPDTAERIGQLVGFATKKAIRDCEEVRCDFMLMDCEVFARPIWLPKGPRPATYFWLGAEGRE